MRNEQLALADGPDSSATQPADGHPAPARRQVPLSALWFGFVGAPAAWSVQTLVNLSLTSHTCYPRLTPLLTPTTGGHRGIAFVVRSTLIRGLVRAVMHFQAVPVAHEWFANVEDAMAWAAIQAADKH